jgi:hypothetical protein
MKSMANAYTLYRFQWGDRVLSLKQALALSTCD